MMLWLIPVVVPAMVAFFWWSNRRREQLLTTFISARLLPTLLTGDSRARRRWREGLAIAAVVAAIVALARPQWGFEWQEARVRGLDILVGIDTSRSMLAEDIKPNRLARAKLAALDLMQQARSDRLGLIAFAGGSFLQCPLTIDDAAFRQSVEALKVGIIPRGGTDLSGAIRTALAAFKEGENHKVLVLFTDGEETDPGALEAAKAAAEAGLKIFTIGVGTPGGEIIQVRDEDNKPDYVRDEQGNVIKSKLNEELLREVAGTASGFYLPLRAQTIDTLYEKGLAPLPKSESQEKLIKRYFERFHWPLGLAILLLIAEMFVPDRAREEKRRPAAANATALAMMLLAFPTAARASIASAEAHYEAGRFADALRDYREAIRKNPNDPRLSYNAGAAAYRAGKLEEAATLFGNALSGPDLQLQQQAWYNRGNARFAGGEKDSDTKKRTEIWQQSLKDFENALKLNPQDKDAEFNRDLVKKRLEELKQQQQQNQDQNKDKDNKDQDQQQNQQDQQKNEQQQQDQQKKDDQKQNQSQEQKQQDSKEQQQQEKQEGEKKQEQKQSQPDSQKPEEKKDGSAGKPDQQSEQQQQQQAGQAREMTAEQAAQLLEGQEGEARLLPLKQEKLQGTTGKPLKDY
jgi:Ca-activated chloride channel family protein